MKRALNYVRVSGRGQALKGYSLENQANQGEKYAHTHGFELVKTFTDRAVSVTGGRKKKSDEFSKMMVFALENDISRIYIYHIDRTGRNVLEIHLFFDWAKRNKIEIVTTNNGFVFDLSKDKPDMITTMQINLFAMFAQIEGDLREERVSAARAQAKKEGRCGPKSRKVNRDGKTTLGLINHEQVIKLLKLGKYSKYNIATRAGCSERSVWSIRKKAIASGLLVEAA